MRKNVRISTAKDAIGYILAELKSAENVIVLQSINVDQYDLPQRLNRALTHLQDVTIESFAIDLELAPDSILTDLKKVLMETNMPISNSQKTKLGDVVKRILRMAGFIQSLSTKGDSVKPLLPQTIVTELERLREARESIKKQIDSEEKKGKKKDENKISELNKSLDSLNTRIEYLQAEYAKIREESKIEKDLDQRIKESFKELSSYTKVIEKERETLNREYTFVCLGIVTTVIFFVIWICNFYGLVLENKLIIPHWYNIIPYYSPIPIFVAIFWVLIYQKNRASRLSNILSEELFQIHYLEGLLVTTNRLTPDSSSSIERLNSTIDSMVNSYLSRLEAQKTDKISNDSTGLVPIDVETILKYSKELIQLVKK